MRVIFCLLVIQVCVMNYGNVYAQKTTKEYVIYEKMLNQNLDFSQNISEDSLKKVFKVVDILTITDLYKVEESFRYRDWKSPNTSNKAILDYINKKITSKREN